MKYLSLFSGIGGFELGIQQAYEEISSIKNISEKPEWEETDKTIRDEEGQSEQLPEHTPTRLSCVGYSEIDKYAIQVYNKHFKHKNYGDITKIIPNELPDFDLLVGGFPCQAFSIAGKRGGFDDTRGTLFFDIARILADKRPKDLLLENVKGLLSHSGGRTFQTIIGVLTDLGYFVEWQVLNSKNFGVPQNRERVFIRGHFGGEPRRKVFPITGGNNINSKQNKKRNDIAAHTIQTGDKHRGSYVADYRHDEGLRTRKKGMCPALKARPTESDISGSPLIINPYNGKTSTEETGTLGTSSGTTTGKTAQHLHYNSKIRRLTPKECERLQGFPDGWTEGLSNTQRYKTLGNAVTVNVIKEIIKNIK